MICFACFWTLVLKQSIAGTTQIVCLANHQPLREHNARDSNDLPCVFTTSVRFHVSPMGPDEMTALFPTTRIECRRQLLPNTLPLPSFPEHLIHHVPSSNRAVDASGFDYSAFRLRRPVPCPAGTYCHPGSASEALGMSNFSMPQPCMEVCFGDVC